MMEEQGKKRKEKAKLDRDRARGISSKLMTRCSAPARRRGQITQHFLWQHGSFRIYAIIAPDYGIRDTVNIYQPCTYVGAACVFTIGVEISHETARRMLHYCNCERAFLLHLSIQIYR